MKTTVAKTLANRSSAWQVTSPGFFAKRDDRKTVDFQGVLGC